MHGLDSDESAQKMMETNRIYYNYLRPHQALSGKNASRKGRHRPTTWTKQMEILDKTSAKDKNRGKV